METAARKLELHNVLLTSIHSVLNTDTLVFWVFPCQFLQFGKCQYAQASSHQYASFYKGFLRQEVWLEVCARAIFDFIADKVIGYEI